MKKFSSKQYCVLNKIKQNINRAESYRSSTNIHNSKTRPINIIKNTDLSLDKYLTSKK